MTPAEGTTVVDSQMNLAISTQVLPSSSLSLMNNLSSGDKVALPVEIEATRPALFFAFLGGGCLVHQHLSCNASCW